MHKCWMPYPSERIHFPSIVEVLAHYLEHMNTRRDSYASDEDSDLEDPIMRRRRPGSSRGSSMRSGTAFPVAMVTSIVAMATVAMQRGCTV